SAEKFESWIFEEVLPSIRKYGAYLGNKTIDELLDNPKFLENLINKLEYKTNSYKEVRKGIGEDYILR
ncbi:MAG: phage repressor protein/antirepressor Ant, partial [Paeniclostridium sordellii]|nr:phage repressor protein/antirepressor Ant [Paeniclostridium sordellii]